MIFQNLCILIRFNYVEQFELSEVSTILLDCERSEPHTGGVQSRFRVIYMCRSVGMSVVYQNA